MSGAPEVDLGPVRSRFRSLAGAIVPETAELDEAGWADLERIVTEALGRRPPAIRKQLMTFIRALDLMPVLRWGRTFRRLDPERQRLFLLGLQRSRIFLVRRGFWGLRTLVYMGYYSRPEGYRVVGYDARLRGWAEHPDAPEAARRMTLAGPHHHPDPPPSGE